MTKEAQIFELEQIATNNGGQVYTHYWADIQGLRRTLFDEPYKYNGQIQEPDLMGPYDLRYIAAGWIGNCHEYKNHEQSQGHVRILNELGIGDLSKRRSIAKLGTPVMVSAGRRLDRKIAQDKKYELPKDDRKGKYYSTTQVYRTKKEDIMLQVVFSDTRHKGLELISFEDTSKFALFRLGPQLLNLIAEW